MLMLKSAIGENAHLHETSSKSNISNLTKTDLVINKTYSFTNNLQCLTY